jgi:hypothetical protein
MQVGNGPDFLGIFSGFFGLKRDMSRHGKKKSIPPFLFPACLYGNSRGRSPVLLCLLDQDSGATICSNSQPGPSVAVIDLFTSHFLKTI